MGKNLTAGWCAIHSELLYYGAKCGECAFERMEESYGEYQAEKAGGQIPADMTFEEYQNKDWTIGEEE